MPTRIARCRPRRRSTTMVLLVALVGATMMITEIDAVARITFHNLCGRDMLLSDGKSKEKIKKDGSVTHELPPGSIKAYRYGTGNEATLAEFSIEATTIWFDISIIPVGKFGGPGNCTSLEHCKQVTGGVGFNKPMKIIPQVGDRSFPDHCRTLECYKDGCDDAYQFPNDTTKTHNCPSSIPFDVVFCATSTTGSSSFGGEGQNEDGVIGKTKVYSAPEDEIQTPTPTTPRTPMLITTTSTNEDNSTSAAVYIASVLAGVIMVFAAVVLVRKHRHKDPLEEDKRSSVSAVMFVGVTDETML